jgi:addiction module HigA family antidote
MKENTYIPSPGDILMENIAKAKMSVSSFSIKIGISVEDAYALFTDETAITPEMALKLEEIFNRPALLWLDMRNLNG